MSFVFWGYQSIFLAVRDVKIMQNRTMVDLQCIGGSSKYYLYLNLSFSSHALLRSKRPQKRALGGSREIVAKRTSIAWRCRSWWVSIYWALAVSIYLQRLNNKVYRRCGYHSYCCLFSAQQSWRVVICIPMVEKVRTQGHNAGEWQSWSQVRVQLKVRSLGCGSACLLGSSLVSVIICHTAVWATSIWCFSV